MTAFEEPAEPPPAPAPELEAAAAAYAPPAVNFHNSQATRTAFLAGGIAAFLTTMPVLSYGCVIWFFAAGFLSVFLYRRRTGYWLSVRSGARMGWLTGIFSFVILMVVTTMSFAAINSRAGGFAALYREQITSMPVGGRDVEEAMRILESPAGLGMVFLLSLVFLFVTVTAITTAGGALGARVLDKD